MKGIITKAVGGFFFPADSQQQIYRTKIRGKVKEKVYPGDLVKFAGGMIEELYPRKNRLLRPCIANVDQVVIVQAVAAPALDRRLLERFLLVVEAEGLLPVIVINKTDLVADKTKIREELADYQKAGYRVCFVSVKDNTGLAELIKLLDQRINVLTGPSGVGKSSLINEIVSGARLKVGAISPRLQRGIHTTRHVELLPIKEGGWVADTPGFTSLDIAQIAAEELSLLYPEFVRYLNQCKFRVCSHTHEPGCSVKNAVEQGEISQRRYQSYQTFYQEIKK